MQPTSANYNPYLPYRWVKANVTFEIVDTTAQEDVQEVLTTSKEPFSQLDQLYDDNFRASHKIASLEHNYFILDGSFTLLSDDNGQVGWWSEEISNDEGLLTTPQELQFDFSTPHSSMGFTISFDDKGRQYADEYLIEALDDSDNVISSFLVENNSVVQPVTELHSSDYYKLRLTFYKTRLPRRRVRLIDVVFGIVHYWTEEQIAWMDLLYEASLHSEFIASNELVVAVENLDRRFNLVNPKGIYKFLQQGQAIRVALGLGETEFDVEYVDMGIYYYTGAITESAAIMAQIEGHDKLYFLNETVCNIGTTGTWTVAEAIQAVIDDCLVEIAYEVSAEIGNRLIGKNLPQGVTHKEAFRLIAQAGQCVCYFNRKDTLVFTEPNLDLVQEEITEDNALYRPANVRDLGLINRVDVYVNNEYEEIEVVYTAEDKEEHESYFIKSIENPLVLSDDVAIWLLGIFQRRLKYTMHERGNPARDLLDTIRVFDPFEVNRKTTLVQQAFKYDGGIQVNSEAIGEAFNE